MLKRVELLSNYIPFLGLLSDIPKIKKGEVIGKIQDKTGELNLDSLNDYARSLRELTDDVDRQNKLARLNIESDECCLAVISLDIIEYLSFADMDRLKEKISGLYALLYNNAKLALGYGKIQSVLFYLDKAISEKQKLYVENILLQPIEEAKELAQSLGAPVIVEGLQFVKEVVGAVAHDLVKKDNFYSAVESLKLEPLCRNIREVADELSYVTTSSSVKATLIDTFEKQWCVAKKERTIGVKSYGLMLRSSVSKLVVAIKKFFLENNEEKDSEEKKSELATKDHMATSLQSGLFSFSGKCKEEAAVDLESRLSLVAPVA